ncbi:MAG: protein O-mannosyl-transferase family [Bacteroidales bacterium]
MNYKRLNNIGAWLAFVIAAFTYLSTIEPTGSFWDCGEFIATSYKYEVGHPPGAPFFMILARFASMFATDVTKVAIMVNSLSAIMSALTILFLFWTITYFAKRMLLKNDESMTTGKMIAILGSGLVGSLAYTFSDTFWFSAVEGEVYASSSMFTALVFWLITKWDEHHNEKDANKYIILIALFMGISIGVHLLNLLTIPAIVFVIYFRKAKKINKKGIITASIISILLLAVVMYGIIQGLFKIAGFFELMFVNTFGLPFHSGLIFHILLLIALISYSIYITQKDGNYKLQITAVTLTTFFAGIPLMISSPIFIVLYIPIVWFLLNMFKAIKPYLNIIVWSIAMILIGYSSFAMILIRSNVNPPLNENKPDNVFSLISYLNREQYGDRPLFYGQSFASPLDRTNPYIEEGPIYIQKDGKYVQIGKKQKQNYASEFNMFFPRMYSSEANHIKAYKSWTNFKGIPVNWVGYDGNVEKIYKPTFFENMKFFFSYQIGWMYFRYFMWNFAGRQNDIQGHGNVMYGNWISGIPFIDNARLGDQNLLPDYLKNNKARNVYYMLPLLLGLIGMYFQYLRESKGFVLVLLLFFFTGIAIVVYLNQTPYQPRERDYAYAGSFYAFAIWIGLGIAALWQTLSKKMNHVLTASALTVVGLLAVPVVMAKQNWDDHDRSNRYTPRDFAKNYLESCDKNAILFTNGDNDTFPLWYAQEVEGIRTDVRVVNLSLLNTDWYIEQIKYRAYDSDPVPISFTYEQIAGERRVYSPIIEKIKEPVDIDKVLEFVKSELPEAKVQVSNTESINYIPTRNFMYPIDSAAIMANKIIRPEQASKMEKQMVWKVNKNYIFKSELAILDIMNQTKWKRPIYFAITVGDAYLNMEDYFRLEGLTYRLTPIKSDNFDGQIGWIDTDILYDRLMNKFVWGNIDKENVYLDENNLRMTMNFRNVFARLANALLREGKRDSAIKVLDKAMTVMPQKTVPYNVFVLGIIEAYFKAGENKKALDIFDGMRKMTEQELNYFLSLDSKKAQTLTFEARRSMTVYNELARIARTYSQEKIAKELDNQMKIYYDKFVTQFPQETTDNGMEE